MSPKQTTLSFPRLPPRSTTSSTNPHKVSKKIQPAKPDVLTTRLAKSLSTCRRGAAEGTVSSASTPRRVETDVLMAIKPVHLANIASRQKNHEYRKYRLRDGVERLWFYETRDGGSGRAAITHVAVIPPDIRRTPGTVPTEPFGLGNDDFNAGRKESKFGYPVLELYELVRPVTVGDMKTKWGMGGAPMGWRFLPTGLWVDRWGFADDDEGRTQQLRRVF
ncbi:hypothetical protein MKZ38_009905 [Zalerion maritima]|uniref:Uncharacterized protein n=1 Tax=Zalerion maritima TaxID=339359 RepID=A0AAD5RFX7_9PEZI|nr:hypothetical protein MKZ38_009905 [Zalerion maritima]